MEKHELRAAASLAAVFSVRMLGLFMVYPVFAPFARHLAGATPYKIGVALGIYGLSQAVLQLPFGALSDRIGRKTMVVIGLVVFAIGSAVAARASTIDGMILGRLLQGGGAIGSVVLAFVADLTAEKNRTKAMALVGIAITLFVVPAALVIFFSGFNIMEASLPSLVTRTAPAAATGTATGIYSSSQFLGIFAGGAVGGWIHQAAGMDAVFFFAAAVAFIWLLVAATMHGPALGHDGGRLPLTARRSPD
jgi:MFS family permease